MALCIGLAMLLWLAAATFVGLLCITFSATGVALAGDVAAGQALRCAGDLWAWQLVLTNLQVL